MYNRQVNQKLSTNWVKTYHCAITNDYYPFQ